MFIVYCSLFVVNCDLFNNPVDPHYLDNIKEEVYWANANKLVVTLDYPLGWGASNPLRGQISPTPLDIREWNGLGKKDTYKFGVEFTPMSGFGFVEWLAFDSDLYNSDIVSGTLEEAKASGAFLAGENAEGIVEIIRGNNTATGAITATVIIKENKNITLVPFCDSRLRVTMTDPPLINTGVTYVRSKEIRIHFSSKLGYDNGDEIPFGDNLISITGQNLDDNLPPWENPQNSFYNPVYVYNALNNYIRITAKTGELMPPENALVTVTVNTGIQAENGYGLAAPVEFFYRTNADTVTRAYKANNIWAIHDPAQFTDAEALEHFFYRGGAREADRRLRTINNDGKYQVTLYFFVTLSDPTIEDPSPDTVKITELYFADLSGEELGAMIKSAEVDIPLTSLNTVGTADADGYYRDANLGESYLYKAVYTFDKTPTPGIIRLAVQPYRQSGAALEADPWETAISEGRFVAAVYDNAEPSPQTGWENINMGLSGYRSEGVINLHKVYYYDDNINFNIIKFNKNFLNVQDNFGQGIPLRRSSVNKPWTMDDQENIKWQYQIVTGNDVNKEPDSNWHSFDYAPPDINLTTLFQTENENTVREIQVRFKDALDNTSPWTTIERFVYFTPNIADVADWEASYDNDSEQAAVTWTLPAGMEGAEYRIDNGEWRKVPAPTPPVTQQSISFNAANMGTPKTIADTIRSGQAARPTEHTVQIRSYNGNAVQTDPITARIWNIPDMEVNATNMVLLRKDNFTLTMQDLGNREQGKGNNYVLTESVEVSNWVPVDFEGKFYGNGFTVTITGMSAAADMGLFGTVSGCMVRDLTVEYINPGTVTRNSEFRFGGIAGTAEGSAQLINVLVKGGITVSGSNNIFAGGMVGMLGRTASCTASISNAYGGLNLTAYKTSGTAYNTGSAYIGGIAGSMGNPNPSGGFDYGASISNIIDGQSPDAVGSAVKAEKVSVVGSIAAGSSGSVFQGVNARGGNGTHLGVKIGGFVGHIFGAGSGSQRAVLDDCDYREGSIYAWISTASLNMGGAVGSIYAHTNISNCSTEGSIAVDRTDINRTYVGGFVGDFWSNGSMINCSSNNDVTTSNVSNAGVFTLFTGGFAARIAANISYCYAKGNVTSSGLEGARHVGGFAGMFTDGASASYCYASGDVFVNSISANIGGFAGNLSQASEISDCYALGDVYFTSLSISSTTSAGGLVGNMYANTVITRCFAGGSVTVHRDNPFGTTNAGGLAGNADAGTISDSVALGANITATGGRFRNIGRIYGAGTAANKSGNRAFNGTRLFSDAIFGRINPDEIIVVKDYPFLAVAPSASGNDGANSFIINVRFDDYKGIKSVSMEVAGRNPATAGGSPVYDAANNRITGIDRTEITNSSRYLWLDFTVVNNEDTTAVYRLELYPGTSSPNPNTPTNYSVRASLLSRTESTADSNHGQDATDGNLRTASWWTGLGFTAANGWNASAASSRRYPTLLNLGGQ